MPLGSILGLGGSILGGVLGGRQSSKNRKFQAIQNATRIRTTVADAQAAGINPLTAITSGAASGVNTAPSGGLASFDFLGDAVQGVAEAFEDKRREKQAEKSAELDLKKNELERATAGGAGPVTMRTANLTDAAVSGTNLPLPSNQASGGRNLPKMQRPVDTNQGVKEFSSISDPTPIDTKTGLLDTSIDDGGSATRLAPVERFATPNGESLDVVVGPEVDEVVTGLIIRAATAIKKRKNDNEARELHKEMVLSSLKPGRRIKWPEIEQLGSKPSNWDRIPVSQQLDLVLDKLNKGRGRNDLRGPVTESKKIQRRAPRRQKRPSKSQTN